MRSRRSRSASQTRRATATRALMWWACYAQRSCARSLHRLLRLRQRMLPMPLTCTGRRSRRRSVHVSKLCTPPSAARPRRAPRRGRCQARCVGNCSPLAEARRARGRLCTPDVCNSLVRSDVSLRPPINHREAMCLVMRVADGTRAERRRPGAARCHQASCQSRWRSPCEPGATPLPPARRRRVHALPY